MRAEALVRRLILRAPPDLLAAVYVRARQRMRTSEGPSWQEIAAAAQDLGIFSDEDARVFLTRIDEWGRNAGYERSSGWANV